MEIIKQSVQIREHICANKFFTELRAGHLDNRLWLWQLLHHSTAFTKALALRSGLCTDNELVQKLFAEHNQEEASHPEKLRAYMRAEGFFDNRARQPAVTPQTWICGEHHRKMAYISDRQIQSVVFNVIGEGVALDFFTAVNRRFPDVPFFQLHADVDHKHVSMMNSLLMDLNTVQLGMAEFMLVFTANRYDEMLNSWV